MYFLKASYVYTKYIHKKVTGLFGLAKLAAVLFFVLEVH